MLSTTHIMYNQAGLSEWGSSLGFRDSAVQLKLFGLVDGMSFWGCGLCSDGLSASQGRVS